MSARARRLRKLNYKEITAYLFILPDLLIFAIFIGFPVFFAFYMSLHRWEIFSDPIFIGLQNYAKLLKDELFLNSVKNTFIFALGYVPGAVFIPLFIGLILHQKWFRGATLIRTIYFLPVVTGWVEIAVIWQWILNPETGLLNYFLSFLGIPKQYWLSSPALAMPTVITLTVWKVIGFNLVIYAAGLKGIPDQLYEAARVDGATGWRLFRYVTWPLLKSTTFFVMVLSLIGSFQVFAPIYVLTEGGPNYTTDVMVYFIYNNAFQYFRMGYASAMAYVLFLIVFTFSMIQWRYFGRGIRL
ncbi:MAG: carbohydrate ABC transporter permease [Candidatus Bipolaricaulia bacterium]